MKLLKKLKNKKIVFSAFCVLMFSLSVFSQIRIVTKSEYDELNKYRENTSKYSRIVTNIRTEYKDKKVIKSVKNVQRFESKERNHWTLSETVDGITKRKLEIIYYNGKEFRRENEEQWKEINRNSGSGIGGGFGSGISGKEPEKMEQYAIADSTFEKKPARIFSYFRVYKLGERLSFLDKITYIDEENKIIYEKDFISDFHPDIITLMTETTYDYNPKDLKIEVPIK